MAKTRALSERNYEKFGTPVYKKGFIANEAQKDVNKENTFYASGKGIIEKGFYNGDVDRKIPMRELSIFNDVQSLKKGRVQEEELQFTDTRGFSIIDAVLRTKGFTTLEEAEASLPEVLKEVTQKMPNEMKEELERKISFIIYTREWSDTPSDKEISEVLDEVRNGQMRVINERWDDAELMNSRKTLSDEEKDCKKRIDLLEDSPCGRIIGGEVTIAEYQSLKTLLEAAGITEEPGMGILLNRAEGKESEIWEGMSGTQEKDSLFIEEEN